MLTTKFSKTLAKFSLVWIVFFAGMSSSVWALSPPSGRVILTVSGSIGLTNQADKAAFDLTMLSSLPKAVIVTNTPWEKTVHKYQGFYVQDIMTLLDAKASKVRVTALNQYVSEIPIEDFIEKGAIIASHIDDKPISVRSLGPLMVMYDFDTHKELRKEMYFGRAVWQVRTLEFIE